MSRADRIQRINWKVTKTEAEIIDRIADRAWCIAAKRGIGTPELKREIEMDVTACHANGCPLRLSELLVADDFNFVHDVFGINRHIDRQTAQLTHCFSPRYSVPSSKEAA